MKEKALEDILFLDIETVRQHNNYAELDPRLQQAWERKAGFIGKDEPLSPAELFEERAGIYAEFGKVVVIGLGYFRKDGKNLEFRMKSLSSHDEGALLEEFKSILDKFDSDAITLCAHNGKQFDFPYLSRRMVIHGIELPAALRIAGKKPWEINHLDTMELWKFGDFRHFVSLELLAALFDVDSSKSDFDGSQVGHKYWAEENLLAISEYCLRDVEVTARVYLHLIGKGDIPFSIQNLTNNKPDQTDE